MRLRGLLINLCFTVVLPVIAVNVLEARDVSVVRALALSAIFPAVATFGAWIQHRRLDALGAISLAFLALGVVASLVTGDVHFALAKESAFTAVFGLLCLGSLLTPRPIMFYIARSFAVGGDPASATQWNDRWENQGFRAVMRTMTTVWGVAYVCDALVRVVLVYVLSVSAAIVVSPTLAMTVTAALTIWSIRFGKAAERRGAELRARARADGAAS